MNRKQRRVLYRKTSKLSFQQMVPAVRRVIERYEETGLSEREVQIEQQMLASLEGDAPLFHGGLRGREVGDLLLPGGTTGQNPHGFQDADFRRQSVYVTPVIEDAEKFAEGCAGSLYRVQPKGEVGIDLRCVRTVAILLGSPQMARETREFGSVFRDDFVASYANKAALTCPSATVLEVVE
ncbi:hypothetical protein GQE99_18645 [Maritimibacter sp. DP07]|uniref:Uncharacterized protein n=1 Tax=Maritimibacter harenae TaxID=2606218 RepID=A0A845MAF5_9RHOB|nr:hypothetical protein [Maritimibacter harenae]MZR15043.1 hypothetical protein [Maritimibacter harenae]